MQLINSEQDQKNKINPWQTSPGGTKSENGPSWDNYTVDSILGEGAYGKVFKVHKKLVQPFEARTTSEKEKSKEY